MLHLQPRVHFHEEKIHGTVRALLHDELHRAGPHIIHGLRRSHGRLAHLLAQRGCHARRGRFFQHLLMAALHRAVALKQIHVIAQGVAKHLNLDVARALHVFFDQHRVIAKAVDGLAPAGGQRRCKVRRVGHHPHALAAAAGTGLDQHRVTDGVGLALQQSRVLVGAVVAGHQRHPGQPHQALGLGFQPHGQNGGRRRPNEHQAGIKTGARKFFVFTQETIAGVDGLRPGSLGCRNDVLPAQVAVFGRAAPDIDGLVTHADVFGVGIGIGIDRHCFDGHTTRGGRYAAGDLPPIGYEDFVKHMLLLS